jgi:hypothetical protein
LKGKLIIIAFALFAMGCKNQVVNRVIKLNVTETSDYCGGASPPTELLQDLKKEKPFTGTLYVHAMPDRTDDGQTLIISNGKLKQSGFSEGEYFVFLLPKISRNREDMSNAQMDQEMILCLEMVSLQGNANFTIAKKTKSVSFNVHKMCNPCIPPRP